MEMVAAIRANIAVSDKQLRIGQARTQIKGVDFGDAFGADDAVDRDDRLLSCDGISATMKNCYLAPRFPAHIAGRIVDHRLFKRNPRLWESLR